MWLVWEYEELPCQPSAPVLSHSRFSAIHHHDEMTPRPLEEGWAADALGWAMAARAAAGVCCWHLTPGHSSPCDAGCGGLVALLCCTRRPLESFLACLLGWHLDRTTNNETIAPEFLRQNFASS